MNQICVADFDATETGKLMLLLPSTLVATKLMALTGRSEHDL